MSNSWYQKEKGRKVWWLDNADEEIGTFVFSFDRRKAFNLYQDYPHKLTAEEKKIFDKEEPFWKDYFRGR